MYTVVCPAEGQERSRRSAGNTKKRKTCSQQKDTRIKRFWSKHFRQRNSTIFTEYDRKKSRLSSVNIILFLCLKAFTSQACYVPAFLLGTSLANLVAPWGRRVLVPALLPGTRRCNCPRPTPFCKNSLAVAYPGGGATGPPPLNLIEHFCVSHFVSEWFKIWLRLHERAPKTLELPGPLKTLFNIVELHLKKLLNFDVCVVWWCSDGPINSQEYKSFEIYEVTIKISTTEYHHCLWG